MRSSSISIRVPEEALDLINKARQLESVDESLSAFMVMASSEQADAILAEYQREKKTGVAYARVPLFPVEDGPFPSGGEKRMVHIAIQEFLKDHFREVARLLNQNGTQFIVLSSVLRALKLLRQQKFRRRSSAAA